MAMAADTGMDAGRAYGGVETSAGADDFDSAWSAWRRSVDHWTIGVCVLLFAVGVVLAFAASSPLALRHDLPAFHYAWRQMTYGAPAFLALFLFSFLSPTGVRAAGLGIFSLGVAALFLLPVFGVEHGQAAQRWLSVAGVSVQPTEILKPGLVVVAAWMLAAYANRDPAVSNGGLIAASAVLALGVFLVARQPDYSQTGLIIVLWCAMFFAAGGSILLLFGIGGASIVGGAAAYVGSTHFKTRIDNFLDRSGSSQTQIDTAEAAIVNGGWVGRGLGAGVEKENLPDAHADFVLAVAAEEYGFVLVAFIIVLFTVMTLNAIWRLWSVEDAFCRLAGLGLALLIGLQAAMNIAVTAGVAPITGMTLPFISYGGSSMVASGAAMGMLLALTRRRPRAFDRLLTSR